MEVEREYSGASGIYFSSTSSLTSCLIGMFGNLGEEYALLVFIRSYARKETEEINKTLLDCVAFVSSISV